MGRVVITSHAVSVTVCKKTGRTPRQIFTGATDYGSMVRFGLMAKRTHHVTICGTRVVRILASTYVTGFGSGGSVASRRVTTFVTRMVRILTSSSYIRVRICSNGGSSFRSTFIIQKTEQDSMKDTMNSITRSTFPLSSWESGNKQMSLHLHKYGLDPSKLLVETPPKITTTPAEAATEMIFLSLIHI